MNVPLAEGFHPVGRKPTRRPAVDAAGNSLGFGPAEGDDELVTGQGRGPRPKVDAATALRADLKAEVRWRGDRVDEYSAMDLTGWWRHPTLLRRFGPALVDLFRELPPPSVILGPQSRGALVGALAATHLGIGLVELRKEPSTAADSDAWRITRTPPDYQDRNLEVGFRRDLIKAGDRVLLVDDVIETGGQALGARQLVDAAGATWCGVAVICDALADRAVRRQLDVRGLIKFRDL